MKKVKATYILIIILCTFVFTGMIGLLGIVTATDILKDNALNTLQLSCESVCLRFDNSIHSIEQTVDIISSHALHFLDNSDRLADEEYVRSYTDEVTPLLLDMAYSTTGAMSIYCRFNNELTFSTAGLFYVWNPETQTFEETQTTDLDNPEGENIVWYTLPKEKGIPVWTEPYHNKLIDYYMISYTVPIYNEKDFLGVVGMDIDYAYMIDLIDSIDVYDTGYAFLISPEGRVISHQAYHFFDQYPKGSKDGLELTELPGGYTMYSNGTETKLYTRTTNGMIIGISAPNKEIYEDSIALRNKITVIILAGLLCATLLGTIIVTRLFRLSETDQLTGLLNRKGFETGYGDLDDRRLAEMSIFIFDIDYFKHINDNFGHNAGDKALVNMSKHLNKVFKRQLYARWGGDEFIGLLPRDNAYAMLENLRMSVEESSDPLYGSYTISVGYADIDPKKSLSENCAAADSALYLSKSKGRNTVSKF